jgi:hypothetical protein
MTSPAPLMSDLQAAIRGDPFWESYLEQAAVQQPAAYALHLAVLVTPYLRLILDGAKTVESRFSVRRGVPWGRISVGDIVLLKRSGGPISGIGYAAEVRFYQLGPGELQRIRDEFGTALAVQDPAFWEQRASAAFATLLRLDHVRPLPPINYAKRDRRGWVILQPRTVQIPLLGA